MATPNGPEGRAAAVTRTPRLPQWMVATIAVLGAFAVGMGLQYVRAERMSGRFAEADRGLTLARLQGPLAEAALEAHAGRHEAARGLASEFFTRLQRAAPGLPEDVRGSLGPILVRRDSTITLVSRGDSASATWLRDLFTQYRAAVRDAVGGDSTIVSVGAAPPSPP